MERAVNELLRGQVQQLMAIVARGEAAVLIERVDCEARDHAVEQLVRGKVQELALQGEIAELRQVAGPEQEVVDKVIFGVIQK